MTAVVDADCIRAAQFPPDVDVATVLRPIRSPSWETSAAWRRQITEKSPLLFACTYLGAHLRQQDTGLVSFSWMHLDLCTSAQRWIKPGPLRDAWVGPREIGKSFWLLLALPLWALAHGHKRFYLAFANIDTQAKVHLKNLLKELRENDLLLHDFPDLALVRGQSSSDLVVLRGGATIAARGMGETSLGIRSGSDRPGLIVGDDLEKGEVDNSPEQVEKNRSRLLRNILPMNVRGVVQVTGTTTMHDSLIHGFVHAAKGRPEGEWVTAARFTPRYYPPISDDGTLLWPQQWSAEWLAAEAEADPIGYELNYLNDPLPPRDRTYWTPGMFQYDPRFPIADRVLHIDIAVTTRATSDYTAMTLAARDASRQRALIEKVEWGRWTMPQLRERIWSWCEPLRVKPLVTVEANQGGDTLLHSLSPWPAGVEFKTVRSDVPKKTRIEAAHSHYHRRAVWHPWPLEDYEAELCRWPRGKNDDVPDSAAGALAWAFPVGRTR